ncbi:MAG: DUF1343 domain-containing protein [Bacteroidetes bacterium]|nr:MAG: DUF1343 domain-containing protein [Bacteroidota bacterium]
MYKYYTLLILVLTVVKLNAQVSVGAEQTAEYLPLLKGKNVAVVVNPTSHIKQRHLVDSLLALGVKIKTIFAPEHGFRGDQEAGAYIKSGIDSATKLPVISLYGSKKKPSAADLKDVQYIIFDIQDVGARFYTYISTLHYIMESCAENKLPLLVFDRPNPNGHYVDGPVLDTNFKSFVGMHPVPVVHGMTVGEYAKMINGEKWLPKGAQCQLTVIKCKNYTHQVMYKLPIKPSPNLPTIESVYLYPSLCFFEGTDVSVGRGTNKPFESVGKPGFTKGSYEFTPVRIPGVAETPPYMGQKCTGILLTEFGKSFMPLHNGLYLSWLVDFYKESADKEKFFNDFFDKLAGTDQLRKQVIAGKTADEIVESWQPALETYKSVRKKYLLYE